MDQERDQSFELPANFEGKPQIHLIDYRLNFVDSVPYVTHVPSGTVAPFNIELKPEYRCIGEDGRAYRVLMEGADVVLTLTVLSFDERQADPR